MNQRGSSLIIGVLIGAVVVAAIWGAYYLGSQKSTPSNLSQTSPTQYATQAPAIASPSSSLVSSSDETANWKTYTSPRYGFSFRYPAEWVLTEAPGIVELDKTNVHLKVDNKEVLGIYAAIPPMGCGHVDESLQTTSTFQIGQETITANNFCGEKNSFLFQTLNNENKQIDIWVQFVTTPQEEKGREVLKSITGLKIWDRQ